MEASTLSFAHPIACPMDAQKPPCPLQLLSVRSVKFACNFSMRVIFQLGSGNMKCDCAVVLVPERLAAILVHSSSIR